MPQPDSIQITELPRRAREVSRFLRVPYAIYADDPLWVAPLVSDLKKVFLDDNPFFDHAEMTLWVATRDGRDVGRIAGIIDASHNQAQNETTAFWGFFESIDDPTVSAALFAQVERWARGRGMNKLLGPMNPSTNDECGLLVEGFDRSPVFMMTYNPTYYVGLVEGAGFVKAKDLLAYRFDVKPKPLERLARLAEGVRRRTPGLVVHAIRRRSLGDDLVKIKEVYNAAWEENWGFVPMTDAELQFMAKRLKPLLVEHLALIAVHDGEPVGFMLSLPDYNEALQPLRGRTFTPRILGFLRYLFGWKMPRFVRVLTVGVKREYRQRGVDAVMFEHAVRHGLGMGFQECEVSWMLEDNEMILRPIRMFDGARYKTYRLYEKTI